MSADCSDGGLGNADSPEMREPPLSMVRWLVRAKSVEGSVTLEDCIALVAKPVVSLTKAT